MTRFLFFLIVPILSVAQNDPARFVNPLIGTAKMGHTYPGATVPFGAVQLSPDTDTIPYEVNGKYNGEVYKYCAGYRYEDKTIVGFSHTHFNGTGHSDLGDFLLMPTSGKLQMNPGTADHPEKGFRSAFSHEDEKAEAGYYRVKLQNDNILAELTATTRVGIHKYTFPKSAENHIILDLIHGIYNYDDKNVWTYIRVVNDTLVTGYRQTNGWARTRTVYFAMSFSKPFRSYGKADFDGKKAYRGFWRKFDESRNFPEIAGKRLRMHFDFDTADGAPVIVKFALSPVSQANALENMKVEAKGWNFDAFRTEARNAWNRELEKVTIDARAEVKTNFYTALYHAFINPTVYTDVNGQYKGLDQDVHTADGFVNYTTFSLWDTYRALHPLFNLLQPKRNSDMVKSMLAHYDQSALHLLPIWSHYANDNWCMSGYHSVSVIADAVVKGVYQGDANAALDACIATANHRDYEGIGPYVDQGFIPAEKSGISVSNTLEYAYNDWCIAQLAKKLGRNDVSETFAKRSENWRNNYNKTSGFMQPKDASGNFLKNFDPMSTHGQGFIEGNSWNYSFFVPQDPAALMAAMGGATKFAARLDTLFSMHLPDQFFAETEDITREGIIGGYVHGNEPAHHVAYLYDWANRPKKAQAQIRKILDMQYHPTPDGLGGNDDCGQMSAWYLFSSLGFYPVAPGSAQYALGSPLVEKAVIRLENGNTLIVEAGNQGPDHVHVKNVYWNGKKIRGFQISHDELVRGGTLRFEME